MVLEKCCLKINMKNTWYLDDGLYIRNALLSSLLDLLKEKGSQISLHLSKFESYWPSRNQSFPDVPATVQ